MKTGMRTLALGALGFLLLAAQPAAAKPGNAGNGEKVYNERCVWCHGEEGDGEGAGGAVAKYLNPPPRDFTSGMFKIKTSPFSEDFPNDADIFRMIRDGMPGTDMPGWKSVLKDEQDIWDLVAYVKTFAELEDEPGKTVDYGTQVASAPESIKKGNKLFHDGARCSECHGEEGKGDAIKKLKGDNGERTWPRNLTKPWMFRGSSDPKDIFTRISTGIPGAQMPSFADPKSKKKLSIEERWHVANYVNSLAKTDKTVRAGNTVVKADKASGDLPSGPGDPAWEAATPSTFYLVPQMIYKDRVFKLSNDTITARALYNDKEVAILLEWDDRTKSIPGDKDAMTLADPEMGEDRVAVQLPVAIPKGMKKPYFVKGDAANPVNLWYWGSGTAETPGNVRLGNGTGVDSVEDRDAAAVGLKAKGVYKNGTWRVVMKRPLVTADAKTDIQFEEGRYTPIAFQNWDGSNGEIGSKHTLTTWYWLLLKPAADNTPLIAALILAALVLGVEILWARSAAKRKEA
ncbi:MAG TPA: c-type cytochrome [Rhodospirillales bacterium]|nr:c-type cytochrome [Rhodospirillales bacterium]